MIKMKKINKIKAYFDNEHFYAYVIHENYSSPHCIVLTSFTHKKNSKPTHMHIQTSLFFTTAVYRLVVSKPRSLIPSLKNKRILDSKYQKIRESHSNHLSSTSNLTIEQRKSNYQQKAFGTCLEMPLPAIYVENGQIRPCCPARDDQCFYIPEPIEEECYCDEFCMLNQRTIKRAIARVDWL